MHKNLCRSSTKEVQKENNEGSGQPTFTRKMAIETLQLVHLVVVVVCFC